MGTTEDAILLKSLIDDVAKSVMEHVGRERKGNSASTNTTKLSHHAKKNSEHYFHWSHATKKMQALCTHAKKCTVRGCSFYCFELMRSKYGPCRFVSSTHRDTSIRYGRGWSTLTMCSTAWQIYAQYASKNARKHSRRTANKKPKRDGGKVIPRRSWKLAVHTFQIIAHAIGDDQLWCLLRTLCKELSIRLPVVIPNMRKYVMGIRLQYLSILRVNAQDAFTGCSCGQCEYVRICPRARMASVYSVITYNHMLKTKQKDRVWVKTRYFATVCIQRWWRRNVNTYRKRHYASDIVSIDPTPSYASRMLELMRANTPAAKASAAKANAAKLRRANAAKLRRAKSSDGKSEA